jgi:AhpD family alkylhydroperoxidase
MNKPACTGKPVRDITDQGEPMQDSKCTVAATSYFTAQVAELVAIGAAIGANCEPCFKYHYDQARKLGVSDLDMRLAVDLAQKVKETPARAMLDLAERYLGAATDETTAKANSCCRIST